MKITKTEMARTIVWALYNMKKPPKETFGEVERLIKWKVIDLVPQYELAVKILKDKGMTI